MDDPTLAGLEHENFVAAGIVEYDSYVEPDGEPSTDRPDDAPD